MNNILHIQHPGKEINATIRLSASKSISNRILLIQALCEETFTIDNLATAKDTVTMQSLLASYKVQKELNVGPAGTVMRFLTAFLSCQKEGEWELTGSERMLQRPVGLLVNALCEMGAEIKYKDKEGYPPLLIHGKTLRGAKLSINGSVSSQYISALLMIGPSLEKGLELVLEGEITSRPYIEMTIKLMEHFDAKVRWEGNTIFVSAGKYSTKNLQNNTFTVEADWSGASYWFSIAALAQKSRIELEGLQETSLQGDSALVVIYEKLGVMSTYSNGKWILEKKETLFEALDYDFSNCPDIAQTVAVTVAGLGLNAHFTGLHTLKIKETDRIQALINELGKSKVAITENPVNTMQIEGKTFDTSEYPQIATYDDHRMAMAFAPLALSLDSIAIEEPGVVVKSYPEFWEHLVSVGFELSE